MKTFLAFFLFTTLLFADDLDPNKFVLQTMQTDIGQCLTQSHKIASDLFTQTGIRLTGECKLGNIYGEKSLYYVITRDAQDAGKTLALETSANPAYAMVAQTDTVGAIGVSVATGEIAEGEKKVTSLMQSDVEIKTQADCEKYLADAVKSYSNIYSTNFKPFASSCYNQGGFYYFEIQTVCTKEPCNSMSVPMPPPAPAPAARR